MVQTPQQMRCVMARPPSTLPSNPCPREGKGKGNEGKDGGHHRRRWWKRCNCHRHHQPLPQSMTLPSEPLAQFHHHRHQQPPLSEPSTTTITTAIQLTTTTARSQRSFFVVNGDKGGHHWWKWQSRATTAMVVFVDGSCCQWRQHWDGGSMTQ